MLDCPMAADLVPILRADRDHLDERCPLRFVQCTLWLEDLRAFAADNADMRARIANRQAEVSAKALGLVKS
jgi:hypothetical protein